MLFAKWWPFSLGLNMLTYILVIIASSHCTNMAYVDHMDLSVCRPRKAVKFNHSLFHCTNQNRLVISSTVGITFRWSLTWNWTEICTFNGNTFKKVVCKIIAIVCVLRSVSQLCCCGMCQISWDRSARNSVTKSAIFIVFNLCVKTLSGMDLRTMLSVMTCWRDIFTEAWFWYCLFKHIPYATQFDVIFCWSFSPNSTSGGWSV